MIVLGIQHFSRGSPTECADRQCLCSVFRREMPDTSFWVEELDLYTLHISKSNLYGDSSKASSLQMMTGRHRNSGLRDIQ